MSLRDCIGSGIDGGDIDPGRGRAAQDLFDELEAELRGRVGPADAARQAAAETVAVLRRQAVERARQRLLQAQAWKRVAADVAAYRTLKGEEDFGAGLLALLDRDDLARYSNVAARYKAIRGRAHGHMADILARFRRDLVGRVRYPAEMRNLVREAFGEATGDLSAKEMAAAWKETSEFLRLRFNAAGGRIPKRADWGLPQVHDSLKVRKASFAEWRDFIAPRLDPARMIDEATGRPIAPQRLELALREVNEAIRTDGFARMTPSGAAGGRSLANRRLDHRFLVFKDADAWLEYQGRFGGNDPFSSMLSHIDSMSREVALMEVLGPNPSATMRGLAQLAEQRGALRDGAKGGGRYRDRARSQVKLAEDMFDNLTGAAFAPVNARIARSLAGGRQFINSAFLGSAAIVSLTDLNTRRIASRMMGLPQVGILRQVLKAFSPHSVEDRKIAFRLGVIAEHTWTTQAAALRRYTDEINGPEFARRLSDFTLRASGLSAWTDNGRSDWLMQVLGFLADNVNRPFRDLDPALQATFNRYRIGSDAWDILRRTPLYEPKPGATFLRPDDVAARADLAPGLADDLATRLLEMVQTETEFAVPSASVRARAVWIAGGRPGTIPGELMRSGLMYKNFALTLFYTHIRRAFLQPGFVGKGRQMANLVIGQTLMGALAFQLYEIAKGRDPRPMTDAEFWGAALLKGGGLGIFGDFLFADVNRYGGSLAEAVAGPVVGFANDVRRLTIGNLAMLGEDPTNFGREMTNFLRRYTPGGSIWYLRLAYERLVLDEIQRLADPQARRSFRERERRWRREFGQRFYWRPGRTAPDRAPDPSAALKRR